MITAVDTNILLDLLIPGSSNVDEAQRQLDDASEGGPSDPEGSGVGRTRCIFSEFSGTRNVSF